MVTIGAVSVPTLRRFYAALGWPERADSTDDYAAFDLAGARLALFPLAALYEDAHVPPPAGDGPGAGRPWGITLAVNVETREAVDAAVEGARGVEGGRIVKEAEDAFWGGRSACFSDPEGNIWEIAWAPGTAFDERGVLLP